MFTPEVQKYLLCTLSDEEIVEFDLLLWWKKNQTAYPTLARYARALYCVPATAAPIERVWSAGGLIIINRRSRLSPSNVRYILFCNQNYDFCKDSINKT